jgi:hypothetical protein
LTDGIIQKVFKREMLKFEYLDEVMVSNFLTLQQELITEIKRACHGCNRPHTHYKRKFMFKLIGDNQE